MQQRMKDLDKIEQKRREREEARNTLETLVYKLKELMDSDDWMECTLEKEIDILNKAHREISEWLFGDMGMEGTKAEFQSRIDWIHDLRKPIDFRFENWKSFDPSLQRCLNSIKEAEEFFEMYDNMKEEERYHPEDEVENVRKQYTERRMWIEEVKRKQEDRRCRDGLAASIDSMAEQFVGFQLDLAGLTLRKPPPPKKETIDNATEEAKPEAEDISAEAKEEQIVSEKENENQEEKVEHDEL